MASSPSSGARFKIAGTASSPRGYDATKGDVLALTLEQNPAVSVNLCQYSVAAKDAGAPTPTFSSGGIASPPNATVTLTIPGAAGIWSYIIRCTTNNGDAVPGPDGKPDFTVNTYDRMVVVRTTVLGLRHIIFGESTEYGAAGWEAAFNALVDATENVAATYTAGTVTPDPDRLLLRDGAGKAYAVGLDAGGASLQNVTNIDAPSAQALQVQADSLLRIATTHTAGEVQLIGGSAGDVAISAGSVSVTVGPAKTAIVGPTATTSYLDFAPMAEPASPAAGFRLYADSGTGKLTAKSAAGVKTALTP